MEKNITFEKIPSLKHEPIQAYFSKNSDDFVVRERALYEFSASGEHLILNICKKDLSTDEALNILSEQSGIKKRDFSYAGLKDKQGLTYQYISTYAKFEKKLSAFSHPKIKILNTTRHNNKLKIGHLKGNSFFIRLKKVDKLNALKIEQAFAKLNEQGFANYFGYQRFGKFHNNHEQALELLQKKTKLRNKKIHLFLLSAFQSALFNAYLSKRIALSHFAREFSLKDFASILNINKDEAKSIMQQEQFFKLLRGDVLSHYPIGRFFHCENTEVEAKRFKLRDISPTGLLLGSKTVFANDLAKNIEDEIFKDFYEFEDEIRGSRRFLYSFMQDAKFAYNEEKAQVSLEFFLQKGSYATTVLEELLH